MKITLFAIAYVVILLAVGIWIMLTGGQDWWFGLYLIGTGLLGIVVCVGYLRTPL